MNTTVSKISEFHYWRGDDDLDMEWLINRFSDKEETDQMRAGLALHRALEAQLEGEDVSIMADGYRFEFVKDCQLELAICRELSVSKQYGELTLHGRVDSIRGLIVTDYKSTEQFNPDRLLNGYEWRFYLDMMNADIFRWKVFQMKETDEPKVYAVYDIHDLEQKRYPELAHDCADLARDYAAFYKHNKGLLYPPKPKELTLQEQLEASLAHVQAKKSGVGESVAETAG